MNAAARLPDPALYERDFAAWAERQGALLRAGRWAEVDRANLIEEVESLGRDQKSRIASRTLTILVHLMKLAASPNRDPERGWVETVQRSRGKLGEALDTNPSLATDAAFAPVLRDAHAKARQEVLATLAVFGELTPVARQRIQAVDVDAEQLLAPDWWPERPSV